MRMPVLPRSRSEALRAVARAAAHWLDPSSRRPLILLFAGAMGLFLLPLGLDVAWALFFRLPAWFRWGLGQAALVGIMGIGLRRLWTVRPTDAWPDVAGPSPSPSPSRGPWSADAWMPWALRLMTASLLLPIMAHPDGLGFADWDFVLDKFEAVRRSILVWGQFPWWTPWCRGGFPLAAEPQIGAVSLATPFLLALGTTVGLRVAAVLCIGIAVEGAYRLAYRWFREPWSAAVAALAYGLNGGLIVNTAWGYVIPMSYCSLPWVAYHASRIGVRFADALLLGFWMAFMIMNGIQYLTLYAAVLAGLVWLRALRVGPAGGRARMLLHTLAAVGCFLALCGWRFATVLPVILEDRRGWATYWDESVLALPHVLLARPRPDWPTVIPVRNLSIYIETTCYVGPVAILLALASLAGGWRWWHTLTALCIWLGLGSTRWYHPSAWLSDWPVFASAHVVTRWRFVAALGIGMAAGSVLARWRLAGGPLARIAVPALALAVAADLVELAFEQLPLAFSREASPSDIPGPPVPDIVNVKRGTGYDCVARGYGVIEGYEPMLGGYRRDAPTLRRAREDPNYCGEAWTAGGETVRPVSWSPNRIEFRVAPGEVIEINQNPGSWWSVNGRRPFSGMRCAEALEPFLATADERGRIVLEIRPRWLTLGLFLHVFGFTLAAAAWIVDRRARTTSDKGPRAAVSADGS